MVTISKPVLLTVALTGLLPLMLLWLMFSRKQLVIGRDRTKK